MRKPQLIYVISLDRATERWRGCQRRLARLGVEPSLVERVRGFDALGLWRDARVGGAQEPRILARLVEEGVIRAGEVPRLGPDFCIAASHLRALLRVREAGAPWAIVLEDDFELSSACRSKEDLFAFDAFPANAEFVWLHDRMRTRDGDRGMFRRAVGGHGTIAYAVSSAGAEKARQALLPVVAPCDLQLIAYGRTFERPELRRQYALRKIRRGWRSRDAEDTLSLAAYARCPPLFTQRRGPSLKHQAADVMYSRARGR